MRRRFLAGLCIGALAVCPLWSGCATQQQDAAVQSGETNGASSGTSGSGGSTESGSSGNGAGGSTSAGTTSGSGGVAPSSGSGGAADSAGTTSTAGGESGAAGAGGEPSSAGTGGSGGKGGTGGSGGTGGTAPVCNPADCDDKNPCTTDSCVLNACSHVANTTACMDDNDPCTADVCAAGACTHPDNKTCECKIDLTCDDKNVCTDDKCGADHKCAHTNNTGPCPDDGMICTTEACAGGKCVHTSDGSCPTGTPFTVDSFNSGADWTAMKTTPDMRAIALTGAAAFNLEGDKDLFVAATNAATVEFGLASMVGLTKLRVVICSAQSGTGPMVSVGVWNGTIWTDKVLSSYAAIPMAPVAAPVYATIEVPTADFGQPLTSLTKMRLSFAPTGGEKTWQIDEVSAK